MFIGVFTGHIRIVQEGSLVMVVVAVVVLVVISNLDKLYALASGFTQVG